MTGALPDVIDHHLAAPAIGRLAAALSAADAPT
jgi:hypothetical protein